MKTLQDDMDILMEERDSLKSELYAIQLKAQQSERQKLEMEEENNRLVEQNSSLKGQIDALNERNAECSSELNECRERIKFFEEQLSKYHRETEEIKSKEEKRKKLITQLDQNSSNPWLGKVVNEDDRVPLVDRPIRKPRDLRDPKSIQPTMASSATYSKPVLPPRRRTASVQARSGIYPTSYLCLTPSRGNDDLK